MRSHPSSLYREDLDTARCDRPGCDHSGHGHQMGISQVCHPDYGLSASYQNGLLILSCAACGLVVTSIVVASLLEKGGGSGLPEDLEDTDI